MARVLRENHRDHAALAPVLIDDLLLPLSFLIPWRAFRPLSNPPSKSIPRADNARDDRRVRYRSTVSRSPSQKGIILLSVDLWLRGDPTRWTHVDSLARTVRFRLYTIPAVYRRCRMFEGDLTWSVRVAKRLAADCQRTVTPNNSFATRGDFNLGRHFAHRRPTGVGQIGWKTSRLLRVSAFSGPSTRDKDSSRSPPGVRVFRCIFGRWAVVIWVQDLERCSTGWSIRVCRGYLNISANCDDAKDIFRPTRTISKG